MTHSESILQYLREHNGEVTLGDLLDAGRFSFAHKLTARISDLRKQGYTITCIEGPNPSKNKYVLIENAPFHVEVNGQMAFI